MAHQHRRTVTMSWDGLEGSNSEEEEEEDEFFESSNRISTMGPPIYSSGSSDDEDYDDSRLSFASTVSSAPFPFHTPPPSSSSSASSSSSSPFPSQQQQQQQHSSSPECHHDPDTNGTNNTARGTMVDNYDIWMAAPGSIKERRRRLLEGMGLGSRRDFSRLTTLRVISKKFEEACRSKHTTAAKSDDNHQQQPPLPMNDEDNHSPPPPQCSDHHTTTAPLTPCTPGIGTLYRSRSDGDIIDSHSLDTKRRQEELIGPGVSKQRLTRTSSALVPIARVCHHVNTNSQTDRDVTNSETRPRRTGGSTSSAQFFLIKNLDTGKDFVVKECDENGKWNRLSDMQTGKQLTMEEFEKTVGHSPVVKELMRRQNVKSSGLDRKMSVNALVSRSFRFSKRRGKSFLRNIKSRANSMSASATDSSSKDKDRDRDQDTKEDHKHKKGKEEKKEEAGSQPPSSEWVKVKQQGKPYKELTALRLCQEITAHQGSIWTLKFNVDGRYLASAGEDKVIHVWEVQECEIATVIPSPQPEEGGPVAASATSTPPVCPSPSSRHNGVLDKSSSSSSSSSGILLPPLEKKKKGKSASKKGGGDMIPDYVQLPETVFALSEKPVCSFTGHLDDVLDLSWSPTKLLLLSSSMDKTVRLWDMESKTCLKMFAHNDYVTCIQFNPVSDDYFISGSLDAKLRIWSVPGRSVVDWADLHEMVTAACYSPDGQTAAVGSHKGSCRTYSINDGKLNQISNFEIPMKKKKTSKITGFEFAPHSPSELLVTSADSRIRIHNGSEVVNKFKGFRNTSSQIAASYSTSGHHVICPSEDSHVYIWRREDSNSSSSSNNSSSSSGSSHGNIAKSVKGTVKVRSYEQFYCKDVSVAIPWPGSVKFDPPIIPIPTKKNARRPNSLSSLPVSLTNSPSKSDGSSIGKRLLLPPLPRKNTHKADNKDDPERNQNQNHDDNNNSVKPPTSPESVADAATEPSTSSSSSSSLTGETLTSNNSASIRRGDSHSVPSYAHSSSPSWSGRWSLFDGSSGGGGDSMRATAWGLVIVTAGLGGEIRAYQNFGLPVRVARPSVLFSN